MVQLHSRPGLVVPLLSWWQIDWTTVAALVLIILAAVPVIVLLFYVALILRLCVIAHLRKSAPRVCVQTDAGQFVMEHGDWTGAVLVDGKEFLVSASDSGGIPNPALIAQIPLILDRLPSLERIAREHVDSLTSKHQIDIIGDAEFAEFFLGFSDDDESGGETIFVYFTGGSVVHWDAAD
jgi:hypothetical protein